MCRWPGRADRCATVPRWFRPRRRPREFRAALEYRSRREPGLRHALQKMYRAIDRAAHRRPEQSKVVARRKLREMLDWWLTECSPTAKEMLATTPNYFPLIVQKSARTTPYPRVRFSTR